MKICGKSVQFLNKARFNFTLTSFHFKSTKFVTIPWVHKIITYATSRHRMHIKIGFKTPPRCLNLCSTLGNKKLYNVLTAEKSSYLWFIACLPIINGMYKNLADFFETFTENTFTSFSHHNDTTRSPMSLEEIYEIASFSLERVVSCSIEWSTQGISARGIWVGTIDILESLQFSAIKNGEKCRLGLGGCSRHSRSFYTWLLNDYPSLACGR